MSNEKDVDSASDWVDYDSRPFCIHWHDPGDCDHKCTCGHTCSEHLSYGDDPCGASRCGCEKYTDALSTG